LGSGAGGQEKNSLGLERGGHFLVTNFRARASFKIGYACSLLLCVIKMKKEKFLKAMLFS